MSAPKLPASLTPMVLLGLGRSFKTDCGYFSGLKFSGGQWTYDLEWAGDDPDSYYAAHADSEIARLNGHGVEPAKPAADSEVDKSLAIGDKLTLVNKSNREIAMSFDGNNLNVWAVSPVDSEAVALVRKLVLIAKRYQSTFPIANHEVGADIAEAEAFLAKEETKS